MVILIFVEETLGYCFEVFIAVRCENLGSFVPDVREGVGPEVVHNGSVVDPILEELSYWLLVLDAVNYVFTYRQASTVFV